jgi:lysozyme
MKPIPKAAVDLVKRFEGRKLVAYKCPAGIWTIGYGQTGPDIVQGVAWTIRQAEERLETALARFAKAVDELVTVELTDNQRAALISFAYNIGAGNLKSSTLLSLLNQGMAAEAAEQFPRWNKANGRVLAGLVARRDAEMELFLKKD